MAAPRSIQIGFLVSLRRQSFRRFRGPPGFDIGLPQFPAPQRFTVAGGYVGYGYQKETAVFVDVKAPATTQALVSVSGRSLLTLGVQGIDNDTKIKLESGTDVEILDNTQATPQWVTLRSSGQPTPIGQTGTTLVAGKPVVNDNRVGFIRYKLDTCTLTVSSVKERKGHTKWDTNASVMSSHDNTPPGMPPSAEN